MSKICIGGVLGEEWTVYTREDANACINSGGRVQEVGGSGGCASSSIAAMTLQPQGLPQGALAALMVAPFRAALAELADTELGQALERANRLMARALAAPDVLDETLRAEVAEAFVTVGALVAAFRDDRGEARFEERHLDQFTRVAEALAARLNDHEARESAEAVLALIRPFAGRTVREIKADLLNGVGRPVEMEFQGFSSTVLAALQQSHLLRQIATETVDQALAGRGIAVAMELIKARRAIQAKAAELGWVGDRLGDVEAVPGGFRQRYAGADILVGPDGRAFEVHGEIRAKYNALGGPASVLGLPVTDETGTPDGIGRYNHFAKDGSIYWTPRTGPMMVRGRVRQEWQSQGWERGPMGYPIRDQQALTGVTPAAKPNLGWCLFENGAIMSMAGAGATAVAAEIQPEQLRGLVRRFFDQRLKAERSELGLEAAVETLSVTPWTYGFWSAVPRAITFGLHGFHDNGLLPDTTFDLQIRLRFSTAWPQSFFYPGSMTLVAALDWLRIRTSGLGSGTLANALRDGIWNAFHRGGPDPDHPEVPDGAVFLTSFSTGANQTGNGSLDVIDVLTTSAGGLQVLLNPLPPLAGGFRKAIAQNQVDAFLET